MAATTMEAPPAKEAGKGEENAKPAEGAAEAPAKSGGLKQWLPLILAVVLMPVLAFVMTHFVLLPKLQKAVAPGPKPGASAAEPAAAEGAEKAKEGEKSDKGEKGKEGEKSGGTKVTVSLSKMLVNVFGTMGTRYLMCSVTLVGATPDFKDKVAENKDQLTDLANGILSSKTIADLEKPGARNIIRTELITVFNNALAAPLVKEIYITELAIQ